MRTGHHLWFVKHPFRLFQDLHASTFLEAAMGFTVGAQAKQNSQYVDAIVKSDTIQSPVTVQKFFNLGSLIFY